MNVLIRFTHGLGDAVQLTVVLQHLREFRPDWNVYVWAMRGKHSAAAGLCKRVWHDQEAFTTELHFDNVFDLGWWECYESYADSPSTKACKALREEFGITPVERLCRYSVAVSNSADATAKRYLDSIDAAALESGKRAAVLLHYEGNTSPWKKNIDHATAGRILDAVRLLGYKPVLLDWDRRSPHASFGWVHNPSPGPGDIWGEFGSGDAEMITALAQNCEMCIGIDSGPQKCMIASGSQTIAVWTGHSPVQFSDLSGNATHLVSSKWREIPPCQNPVVAAYFRNKYRYREYDDVGDSVIQLLRENLKDLGVESMKSMEAKVTTFGDWHVTLGKERQDDVVIKDVWDRDCYRTHLVPDAQRVLDVGAHIGVFAKLWKYRNPNAQIVCVEVNKKNIPALTANVGWFAGIINAACSYEKDLMLLDSICDTGVSTGGSRVVPREVWEMVEEPQYERSTEEVHLITIEEIMARYGWSDIDLLKLDCEGSEYSILEHAPIDRIRFIVGEYHGRDRWEELRRRRFSSWDYGHMSANGDFGNFHLRSPKFPKFVNG